MTENLWGEIPGANEIPTMWPLLILKEQVDMLAEMTGGVLRGKVRCRYFGDSKHYKLDIIAPILNNYDIEILSVKTTPPEAFLPIVIYSMLIDKYKETICHDEAQYISALELIFQSEKIKFIMSRLISESIIVKEL